MELEECLRSELARVTAVVDHAAPLMTRRRSWLSRLASKILAGLFL
jgi:hypothetical protein